jgi:hypothetical protein
MAQKLCDKYFNLNGLERSALIGQIVHAIQVDDTMFDLGQDLINMAVLRGLYTEVKFNPEPPKNDTNE